MVLLSQNQAFAFEDGFAVAKPLGEVRIIETFGRGCLYIILGVIVVMVLAFIVGGTISIPWFIVIPLIILAFWAASRKNK
ncbi:hypothetical protein [Paenibacillus castaneae]|uniref:hypothetical protein n=1 Tax=Paenibacillus castaneae TaxID=474957 RepID=UPI000C9CEF56|nr:hypothetical protein [Paenibacillus castaneae]